MADRITSVQLEGFAEFERDLRRLNKDYVRILRKEIREAAQPIRDDIRARYRKAHPRRGGGRRRVTAGKLAAVRRGRAGQISIVGNKGGALPFLRRQEFGARRGERDVLERQLVSRFPATRSAPPPASGPFSHFFFVAGYEGRDEASRNIVAAIDRANRRAFPDP